MAMKGLRPLAYYTLSLYHLWLVEIVVFYIIYVLHRAFPVGKIAEKAVCRSVFLTIWYCILSVELTKNAHLQTVFCFFWWFCPLLFTCYYLFFATSCFRSVNGRVYSWFARSLEESRSTQYDLPLMVFNDIHQVTEFQIHIYGGEPDNTILEIFIFVYLSPSQNIATSKR